MQELHFHINIITILNDSIILEKYLNATSDQNLVGYPICYLGVEPGITCVSTTHPHSTLKNINNIITNNKDILKVHLNVVI